MAHQRTIVVEIVFADDSNSLNDVNINIKADGDIYYDVPTLLAIAATKATATQRAELVQCVGARTQASLN